MAAATISRLASIRAGTPGPSSARASPRATSITSCTVSPSPLTITVRMAEACHHCQSGRDGQSVPGGTPERRGQAVPARPGDPDGAPGRPALDPAELQQPRGDGGAEGPVQVRAALRPVQAGAGEAAPGLPDLGHVYAEIGQRVRAVRGDLVRGGRAR